MHRNSPETFVARRWSTDIKDYVDSRNKKLMKLPVIESAPGYSTASRPPASGVSPLLSLPTELRLRIYEYLTSNNTNDLHKFPSAFGLPSSRYAYLYRSPGRLTKPGYRSKKVVDLFHVCHQMREELIDSSFNDKPWVLEAALYQKPAGGLHVLPSELGPIAWVKRLLLLTAVEVDGRPKGIADLRCIQQMTNLKHLQIVFVVTAKPHRVDQADIFARADNPIKAVLECVPKNTNVQLETGESCKEGLLKQFGPAVMYLAVENRAETKLALKSLEHKSQALNESMGRLSGSTVDHSLCRYPSCQERRSCVNSHVQLSLPAPFQQQSILTPLGGQWTKQKPSGHGSWLPNRFGAAWPSER